MYQGNPAEDGIRAAKTDDRERARVAMRQALDRFLADMGKICEVLQDSDNEINNTFAENYPPYLPSFDDFQADMYAVRDGFLN